MASIKVKFRPSSIAGHKGVIFYQLIHERKVRQLITDYRIYDSEWNEKRSIVSATVGSERASFVISICERIRWDVERLIKIVRAFDRNGLIYTVDDVVDEFHRYEQKCSLFNFMESVIVKLKHNGKVRTAETYVSTLNSFKKFLMSRAFKDDCRMDGDIMLDRISSEIMEEYAAHLQNRGVTPNTVSFYMRILRAVYNRAVERGLIEQRCPFRHVYTGVDKTVKRALPLSTIRKIKHMDLLLLPKLDYARDMFMMSFYLRGMSFVDMAFLRKADLKNGYVTYRRRKTGQQLIIEWTKEMQVIVEKYSENKSGYLLPIIRNRYADERNAYRNAGYNINRNLKKIAAMLGIPAPITLYVARHSWASAAKAKGIPLSVISEGMGHDSEATTRIYLASLDISVVDKANSLILSSL